MKKLLTTLLCFVMALSCVFGVAACAPTDDKGNTGVVTPGGDQPGGTEQPGGIEQPGGTEQPGGDQPGGDEQDPGGEETPEPAPEPSEGLEFFLVTEDDAESMKEILGYYYTPCYGLIGMGTCTDTDIVIPAEYNGLPVCVVRLDALSESVTSLYFPDSVDLIFCEYAPNFRALTDLRLPHNPDLMIMKLSPTEITPSPFANSAFYQDPDNWEDGALYMDDWLLATNEDLPTDYTVKAGTYGIAGMAFSDAYYGASTSPGENINRSNSTGSHVERVTLPDSVKALQAAFMNCQSLKEVVLADGILTKGRINRHNEAPPRIFSAAAPFCYVYCNVPSGSRSPPTGITTTPCGMQETGADAVFSIAGMWTQSRLIEQSASVISARRAFVSISMMLNPSSVVTVT